ncbi:hypothetical protein FOFC_19845 [Fusarium oxysporum]|nr:hypothetical protein FOFC_19845 [Fusarium oxysporum]
MERSTDDNPLRSERSRASGERPLQNPQFQSEWKHPGPSTQNSSFTAHGSGSQYNAPYGTQSISTGNGPQFPGATFHGSVYFSNRFHDIDTAAKGTCEWLLLHKTYKSWTSCDRGLLWIKGKPGSGKSTLLRYVLDHVMEIPNTREGALILSFFFHGRGSELQKTPFGLFRSLLHQLLDQVPEALTDLVATFKQRCETIGKPGEQWQWHTRELQRFLESSLPKVLEARTVWLFVDALDECGEENAAKLAREFKSLLQGAPSTGSQFHICFACRHYPILVLDGVFEVWMEKENRKDISTFAQDKLSSFRKRMSSTIPDLITEHADGVFLWAGLVVNQVLDLERKGIGLKKIETEILSVPQELDALYCQLIRNMDSDSLKLIQWICFAMRPLSLDELRWAMIVDADCPHRSLYACQTAGDYPSDHDGMKRRVQTLSRGLAEVTSDTKVVQFIHQSVKDFFVEKGLSALDETAKTNCAVGIAHRRLSRTCIRYLAMEEIGRSASQESEMISEFPFLHYATTWWVAHTKQSDARSVSQEDLLDYFAGPSNTLMERWVRIYRILDEFSNDCPLKGTSLVHVMSRYGVAGALGAILGRADQVGINIDGKDSHGRTPLSWAAGGGHEVVVQVLLKTGKFNVARWPKAVVRLLLLVTGKVNVDTKDGEGRTPLWWATKKGHKAVVQLLLDWGAYIEAADEWGQTPLARAAETGHKAVVQLLLDRGAYIEAADEWDQTPLSYAAQNGHEAVVQLLLDRGAHIEAADKSGQTPLSRAAENGHEAVVQLLLDRAAKNGHEAVVRLLLGRGQTSLRMAVVRLLLGRGETRIEEAERLGYSRPGENWYEAVVRLLLGRGAHIEAAERWGRTPLSRAAEKGHEAVVRLLLDRAAKNGHEAVVRLLLGRGAHIEAAERWGRTPLSRAAENGWWGRTPLSMAVEQGHEAVVRLLLGRGETRIEEAERLGLSRPGENWYEAVVRLLLGRGAHIEAAERWGRTPLSYAAQNGHEAVVRLLLDRGAHIEAADKWDQTPLSYAAQNGHEAVVQLLLDGGAERGHEAVVRLLLDRAAKNGHEAIVRLFLDGGACTEVVDEMGQTLLLRAAENGHEAIVRLLLDRAAKNGHEAVVRLLLDGGACTEVVDEMGQTPLLRAAENGHEAVVRLLLDRDAHIEAADKSGQTPLSRAAQNGHEAVVRLLQFHGDQPSSTTSP